jgi:N-acetylglutamate synthase-like GNAT family acetyltransferase
VVISPAQPHQFEDIVAVIQRANAPVAEALRITPENASGHTAFYTKQRLLADLQKGNQFFVFIKESSVCGCIALRQADKHVWYLNRLATIPKNQGEGVGTQLLNHAINLVESNQGQLIKIGTIAEHKSLTQWYCKRGFIEGKTKQFKHLPFQVLYMSYSLNDPC